MPEDYFIAPNFIKKYMIIAPNNRKNNIFAALKRYWYYI
jgi:hypothetical protein